MPKIYNFLSYRDILYQQRREYRKGVRYVIEHLALYNYVVGNSEIEKISCKAFDEEKTKRMITESEVLEIDRILDRIREGGKSV